MIDLNCVHRLETSAVELLEREARENVETRALVFCGVSLDSVVYADLQRGGLRLNFGARLIKKFSPEMMQKGPLGFEERAEAIEWCKAQKELCMPVRYLEKKPKNDGNFDRFLPSKTGDLTGTQYERLSLKKTLSGPSGIFPKPKDSFKTCSSHPNIRSHKKTLDHFMISSQGLRVRAVKSSHTHRRSFSKTKVSTINWICY